MTADSTLFPPARLQVQGSGAVHAMGNGRLLVYAKDADITHLFGPVYSSSSLISAGWTDPCGEVLKPSSPARVRGSSVWTHRLGTPAEHAAVTMAVDPELDVLMLAVETSQPATFTISPSRPGRWVERTGRGAGADAFHADPGAPVFIYPYRGAPVLAIAGHDESCAVRRGPDLSIGLPPGRHRLVIVVAADPAGLEGLIGQALAIGPSVLERRVRHDGPIAARVNAAVAHWPDAGEWGALAADRAEGAALAIVNQQSADGGLMAGYPYPLAYGRDQYGSCRGLSAVGLADHAAANFWFRQRKLERFGDLANAESMGHDDVRHLHETDAVELTSYHVLQATELARWREGFDLESIAPSLARCLTGQLPYLRAGLLPFNGDETYVAGGILPRSTLEDGSLESALLFIEAVDRLAALSPTVVDHELIDAAHRVGRTWRHEFADESGIGGWSVNAPRRRFIPPFRPQRHGVCEACGHITIGDNRRTASGRYLCPDCLRTGRQLPSAGTRQWSLLSAILLPFLINPDLLTPTERERTADDALSGLAREGFVRTTPDQRRTVGYDAGLVVLAAATARPEQLSDAVNYLLSMFDETDTLSEYVEGSPVGTRCRPWETGVALAALDRAVNTSSGNRMPDGSSPTPRHRPTEA